MTPATATFVRETQPAAERTSTGRPEGRVRVLQLGPSLAVRGGVSTVEQLIMDYLPQYVAVRHVPTMDEGSTFARAHVYARALGTLRGALRSLEPTIVHIHFASRGSTLRKMILAEMVTRAGRPMVLHAHGAGFDDFYRKLPGPLRRNVCRILQRANVFIALSSQWREFYIEECELIPGQVTVLPNPVRVSADVPHREGRKQVQFLFLGRLGERKGAYDLVRAFGALPDAVRARARLVLAGDGDVAGIRKLAAPYGANVRVLSWIDARERDRLLAQSDVFTLPSRAEGIPMALLEAMAAGLPGITTAVGGIPDVFRHGTEGLLVQPGDVAGLSAAMARYVSDDAARLEAGRRAHERARAYDIHVYARRLAEIYQRIAPVGEMREIA